MSFLLYKVMMVSLVPKLVLKAQPKLDVVFLIDCSGSMNGSSIRLAREAINILLHSLPSTVLFNIVCFGSRYTKLFPHSLPYSDKTLGEAKEAMSKLGKTLLKKKTPLPVTIFLKMSYLSFSTEKNLSFIIFINECRSNR